MTKESLPFWKTKTIYEMTDAEWESLCDRCAQCCVYKTEDEDTGEIHYSDVACPLLDLDTCLCTKYATKAIDEPDCTPITRENIHDLTWLPATCAYLRIATGQDLPSWHPLITGDPKSTQKADMTIRNYAKAIPASHKT